MSDQDLIYRMEQTREDEDEWNKSSFREDDEFVIRMKNRNEIAGLMEALLVDQTTVIDGVSVTRRSMIVEGSTWWVQAGGGVTHHRSTLRAASALIRLRKSLIESGEWCPSEEAP